MQLCMHHCYASIRYSTELKDRKSEMRRSLLFLDGGKTCCFSRSLSYMFCFGVNDTIVSDMLSYQLSPLCPNMLLSCDAFPSSIVRPYEGNLSLKKLLCDAFSHCNKNAPQINLGTPHSDHYLLIPQSFYFYQEYSVS
jgi:hypothetical protein